MKTAARLRYLGDKLICAKWTPWARQKFNALDDGSSTVFVKNFDLGEIIIKLHRVGDIRRITFLSPQSWGLVCLPIFTGAATEDYEPAPYGWGTPFKDEEGELINAGLGTETDSEAYENSPYNLIYESPDVPAQTLVRKTRHTGKPWDIGEPMAYGMSGAWNRGAKSLTWDYVPFTDQSYVYYRGLPAFYQDTTKASIIAAAVFDGDLMVLTTDGTDNLWLYQAPLTQYAPVPTSFTEYLHSTFTITFFPGGAHINPDGKYFVFIAEEGIQRVDLSVVIDPETGERTTLADFDEAAYTAQTVERSLTMTGVNVDRLMLYSTTGGGFYSSGSGQVNGKYGFSERDYEESISDTVAETTLSRQIGLLWDDAGAEAPITLDRTYSMDFHTIDSEGADPGVSRLDDAEILFDNPGATYGSGGYSFMESVYDGYLHGKDWSAYIERDRALDKRQLYSFVLSDESEITFPPLNLEQSPTVILSHARYVTETGSRRDLWDKVNGYEITFAYPETTIDALLSCEGELIEIDSETSVSDDGRVVDIATRKVTRTYSYSYDRHLLIDNPGFDADWHYTYNVTLSISCKSEYTQRRITLDGEDFAGIEILSDVDTSLDKAHTDVTEHFYNTGSAGAPVNSSYSYGGSAAAMFLFGGGIFGNFNNGPVFTAFLTYPVTFSASGRLYPNAAELQAVYDDDTYIDSNASSPYGWGEETFTRAYTFTRTVDLTLDLPLLDNPMRNLGIYHAQRSTSLLYQRHIDTRPLGDVVAKDDDSGFETIYSHSQEVPVMYLSGIGWTAQTQAFFGMSAYDTADIHLLYKSLY